MKSSRRRRARVVLLGLSAALLAAAPALGDPSIEAKQVQARHVLEQIHQMDVQLEKAIEAYNLANIELDKIRRELRVNRFELKVARHNLRIAQRQLAERLRTIYISGESSSTLEILLGATSLDDFLNRIETVDRVSDQDALVLRQVTTFRERTQRRAEFLKRAHDEQRRIVAERAAAKRQIEAGLAERQRLLSSIRDEIARLQAEERRRQAELARQARLRLLERRRAQAQQQLARQLAYQHQQQIELQPVQEVVVGASVITPEGETVAPPAVYGGVVGIAMQYLGIPYQWGGASPETGFDCSGFVMYVYAQVGVSLPHNAAMQYGSGVPVSKDQLEPGDLVFFDGLGHNGIYIGGGQFIHSPHTGEVVKISSLSDSWYAATYVGARRIV